MAVARNSNIQGRHLTTGRALSHDELDVLASCDYLHECDAV
jgi:hypothetical protein